MRILLLRASAEAARSAAELQKKGHRLILSPVVEIAPADFLLPEGAFDGLIASSAHAFSFLEQDEVTQLKPLPLLCVGSKTALAALRRGFPQSQIIAPNAKSLTPLIAAKFSPPAHFLYLAGEDRKPDLEADLAAAGFQVTVQEVYCAEPVERLSAAAASAIEYREADAALHYSRRSAEIFLSLATDAKLDVSGLTHFCISADSAEPLAEAGLPHIFIADTPDETALFAKLTGFSLSRR